MALYNRVKVKATSAGTLDFALGAEETGYRAFSGVVADDATVPYLAESANKQQWELGLGTYDADTNALARTTVYDSSNAGNKTNFTTAPFVSINFQKDIFPAGAVVGTSDSQTLTNKTLTDPIVGTQSAGDNSTKAASTAYADANVNIVQNFRNACGRNGGFEIWQRLINSGTTIAIAASTTAYGVDGWYLSTGANQAFTLTKVAGLDSRSNAACRVQRNSGQTGTGTVRFAMPLDTDELSKLRGQTCLLSFRVSTGANWSPSSGTLTYNVYCGTGAVAKRNGSSYTSESNPITGSVNLATSASSALVVSAISSAISTSITQAEVQFSWTPSGTAGANDWFSIDDVQLEAIPNGVAPTTPLFERSDYSFDLLRCQRHLPVFNATGGSGGFAFGGFYGTTAFFAHLFFRATIRAPITNVTISNLSHFSIFNSGTSASLTPTSFSADAVSDTGADILMGVASGGTVGAVAYLKIANAGAQIIFTGAEI